MNQPLSNNRPPALLSELFYAALDAASPAACLAAALPDPATLPADGRLIVVGAGKAAASMAAVAHAHFGDRVHSGCVVTRYGHGMHAGPIEIIEAAHPVPDQAGEQAAHRVLASVSGLTERDTVIALMSGGASALLALPAGGITLQDKQSINRALLASGASIADINVVRKHLSAIKGGRLAQACMPARLITYVISDVPGDDPSTVGSGPTLENVSTPHDALRILQRYGVPAGANVLAHLMSERCRTPVFTDAQRARMHVQTVATARTALLAATEKARAMGLNVWLLSDNIEGEARDIGAMHAALAIELAKGTGPMTLPCVLLSGGETTVTVKGHGRGGRNAEFLLGLLHALGDHPGISAIACDTDGIDGIEDNAGAWFEPGDAQRAVQAGLNSRRSLDDNDAWTFFKALDRLVITGPTRTNVNDFRAVLVQSARS